MSDDASEIKRLLSPLRERPVSVRPERLEARRARIVASLKQEVYALSAERRARPRRRAGYAALGLAAAACLLVGARFFARHDAGQSLAALTFVGSVGDTIAGGGANPRHLQSGEHIYADPGEVETAAQGSAELVNASGLGLHLGEATRVSLGGLIGNERKNQVDLRQGSVTCTVPHLNEGQRFSVSTPDARVVVHGTVFSVQVDSKQSSGNETCVRVTDGVVIVQHGGSETALNAGESWGCGALALGDNVAAPPAPPATGEDDSAEAVVDTGRVSPRAPASARGTLNDEIRLFQAALAAERLGQKDQAELDLNRLLGKYPSSPLAPEARRALTRIASGSNGK